LTEWTAALWVSGKRAARSYLLAGLFETLLGRLRWGFSAGGCAISWLWRWNPINLKGVAIGNGLTMPGIQFGA
jgi:hypothetical protein